MMEALATPRSGSDWWRLNAVWTGVGAVGTGGGDLSVCHGAVPVHVEPGVERVHLGRVEDESVDEPVIAVDLEHVGPGACGGVDDDRLFLLFLVVGAGPLGNVGDGRQLDLDLDPT